MVQERKLTSIRLSAPLYEYLQKKAKKENRSVNNYIETVLINDWEKEPNEETLKAFAEATERPEDLEEITDVQDFLVKIRDGRL